MKTKNLLLKILVTAITLACWHRSDATIVFSENFDNGMAASSMSLINNDGNVPNVSVAEFTNAWITVLDGADSSAASTSWYTPAGQSDDWMVTPSITLTPGLFLSWEAIAQDANYPDGYEVYLLPTSLTPTAANFTTSGTQIFSIGAENPAATTRIIDLGAAGFTSGNYYIGFRNNSSDMYILRIDDILVADVVDAPCPFSVDFTGTQVENGYYMVPASQIGTHSFTGYFINDRLGLQNYDYDVTVSGAGSYSVSANYNLASGTQDSHTIGSFTPSGFGDFYVEHRISMANDCDTTANVISDTITVSDSVYARERGTPPNSLGVQGGTAELGQIFSLLNSDDLTSLSFYLNGGEVGDEVRVKLYNTSGGTPSTAIDSSANIVLASTTAQWYTVSLGNGATTLSPGDYFVSLVQLDTNNIGLGRNDNYYTPGYSFVSSGGALTDLSTFGFFSSFAIRMNFGPPAVCDTDIGFTRATVEEGYYQIPLKHISPWSFTGYYGNVSPSTENFDLNINVSGTGTYSTSANYTLASGIFDTTTIGSYTPTDKGDYIVNYNLFLASDCDPNSNILEDTVTINDSVYARERGATELTLGFPPASTGQLAQSFKVVTTDFLSSVSVFLDSAAVNDQFKVILYNMSGGFPTTAIDSSAVTTVTTLAEQWYHLKMLGGNISLSPGDYAIAVFQMSAVNNINLGRNDNFYSPGKVFYQFTGSSWNRAEDGGFNTAYLIRANFGFSCAVAAASVTDDDRCGSGSVTLGATPSAGGTGVAWYTTSSGGGPAFSTSSTYIDTYSTSTTYYVATTAGAGCESTVRTPVTATINTIPTAVASADTGICTGGTAIISATGGATYSWDNSLGAGASKSVSPTSNTTYTVTATASNGCTNTDVVTVSISSPPTAAAGSDATICDGQSTTLTASGGATYSWDNGLGTGVSHSVSPSTTTTYIVTADNGSGCTDTDNVTITVNPSPTANAGVDDTICSGESTNLLATGGGTYAWDNSLGSGASKSVSPTSNTTYNVTVTSSGCTNSDAVTIYVNTTPTANAGGDASVCLGNSANLSASGAATYSWDNGLGAGSAHTVTPSTTTTYTVTASSIEGCTDTDDVIITIDALPVAAAGSDVSICQGTSTNLMASGGSSYSWDNGLGAGASKTVSPSDTTNYMVTVTGSNGCTATDNVTVNVLPLPTAFAGNDVTICTGASAQLTATGGASYNWSGGLGAGQAQVVTPSSNTTYTVTVTSSNGCTDTDDITITVNPIPGPTAVAGPDTTVCEGATVSIAASGGINYSWDNLLGTGSVKSVTPTTTTTYTVTVTDGNGCSDIASVNIIVNASPVAVLGPDTSICEGESITLIASGGDTYSWDNGLGSGPTKSISPTITTVYVVTASSSNGCTDTDDILVTVNTSPAKPSITLFGNDFLSSATTGNQWLFNGVTLPGETATTYTPSIGGFYSVRVTNANGCSNTSDSLEYILGIKEEIGLLELEVYPNPTDGIITMNLGLKGSEPVNIILYDVLGNQLKQFKLGQIHSSQTQLDFRTYPTGVYFMDVQIAGHSFIKKVVVK